MRLMLASVVWKRGNFSKSYTSDRHAGWSCTKAQPCINSRSKLSGQEASNSALEFAFTCSQHLILRLGVTRQLANCMVNYKAVGFTLACPLYSSASAAAFRPLRALSPLKSLQRQITTNIKGVLRSTSLEVAVLAHALRQLPLA